MFHVEHAALPVTGLKIVVNLCKSVADSRFQVYEMGYG